MNQQQLELIIEATSSLMQARADLAYCRLTFDLQAPEAGEVESYNHKAERANMLADSIVVRLEQLGVKNESITRNYFDYAPYLNSHGKISKKQHGTANLEQLKEFMTKERTKNNGKH